MSRQITNEDSHRRDRPEKELRRKQRRDKHAARSMWEGAENRKWA